MPMKPGAGLPNRSIARAASISARACGVEMITAPSGLAWRQRHLYVAGPGAGRPFYLGSPQSASISD